ncbi:MAG: S-layer protein, partial [Verrucomicrobia bacterium]|nr:S-layer protein [Verrucomicrobiota bacterium]
MNRLALFCGLGFAASFASAASATATKPPASPDKPVSFVNDVLPVLGKAGCNAGTCHAKADGKGGFKLSVFAYDPRADFYNITRAARG